MKQTTMMNILQTAALAATLLCCTVSVAQPAVLKATVRDIDGKPAQGVKIFLYESTNVRKPADFISAQSDKDGRVIVMVPAGTFWAVARFKKDALYGPLMPGDKHSGDPVVVECSDLSETDVEFVIADIREIGQKKRTSNADTIKLWGRVIDKEGAPVAHAYVFASTTKEIEYIPEYLSAWTDEGGNYTLYLPAGASLFVGSARQFPPLSKLFALREVAPEAGKSDIATDIQLMP
jgi:hypothetical protein